MLSVIPLRRMVEWLQDHLSLHKHLDIGFRSDSSVGCKSDCERFKLKSLEEFFLRIWGFSKC